MNINLVCPTCKQERKFDKWWYLMFGEERAIFHQQLAKTLEDDWYEELPYITKEIKELEQIINEKETRLPQKELMDLKVANQKLLHLYGRLNNHVSL